MSEPRTRLWTTMRTALGAYWAIGIIVVLASGLRFWGIDFGLPYTYAPDEPSRLNVSLTILKTGDLNPHWLGYPHLAFYLNTLTLAIYFLLGRLGGVFVSPADISYPDVITIGVGKLDHPEIFLIGRGLTALLSVGAVILVYLIGRRYAQGQAAALLAAFVFAVSPAAVAQSKVISLDAYGVFFLLLAFYWIVRANETPSLHRYVWAGIGVALAFSGKYNVGVIILTLVVVHGLNFGFAGWRRKEIYLALCAAGLTFAMLNPFSVLDLGGFLYGLTLASGSQSQYAGTSQNGLQWYWNYGWQFEGPVIIPALGYALLGGWRRSKKDILLISFPLFYVAFVSLFSVKNDRTLLPAIPFIDLMGALLVVALVDAMKQTGRFSSRASAFSLMMLGLWFALTPFQSAVAATHRLTQRDGRESARQWLDENLSAGTRLAQEGYTPYVNRQRFAAQGVESLIQNSPEWYFANGYEYLIFSEGIYGRMFADPLGYPTEIAKYNELFTRFPQVAHFDENQYTIRIHKTNAALPAQRVAARFGNEGELIELVGYAVAPVSRGEPVRVQMFWRALNTKPEPFELELRLLDETDREVAKTRTDLFQGKGWRSGMFDAPFAMTMPREALPGDYRMQVNVIWTRFAYVLPAFNWAGQPMEPVLLESIEIR